MRGGVKIKKILPLLVVGIFVLSGLGAGASTTNEEISNEINSSERATHAVLGEYGTATWCGYCHYAHTALKNIFASGDYDFYYVSYVRDMNPSKADIRLFNELNLYGYPTCFFDGGYKVVVGGSSGTESAYRTAISQSSNRAVYDVDITVNFTWLGGTNMQIDCEVKNNEGSTYTGTVRVFITEVISSMNWKDTSGKLYTYPLLDYAFDDDGSGVDVSISAGGTWSDSTTWDGTNHGFPSVTENNIAIIGAVYNDDWYQGYAYPPSTNPFDAYYVDDCAAAGSGGTPNNPPETPTISGPSNGGIDKSLTYTFSSVDPDNNDVEYYIKWGDGHIENWDGPYPSGMNVYLAHTYTREGTFTIEAKARDNFGAESSWGTFTVTIPRSKTIDSLFLRFLENHQNMFPILQQLLGL